MNRLFGIVDFYNVWSLRWWSVNKAISVFLQESWIHMISCCRPVITWCVYSCFDSVDVETSAKKNPKDVIRNLEDYLKGKSPGTFGIAKKGETHSGGGDVDFAGVHELDEEDGDWGWIYAKIWMDGWNREAYVRTSVWNGCGKPCVSMMCEITVESYEWCWFILVSLIITSTNIHVFYIISCN